MAAGLTAGTAWVDILPNMGKFTAALSGGLIKSGKAVRHVGSSLTRHVTLPIVAAGAASVKLAVDFDRTFEKMVGLAGVAESEVAGLKDRLLEMATVVGKDPRELAEGLYFLRSAGLSASDSMEALLISAKLSTAGLGETQVVADAISSAINAYGSANLSAAKAGDILAATVREGKGEADAIAPVLGSLLPLSQRLGVSFDQVGASIASMTRIGESAPRAATALRGLYTSLLNNSPKVKEALEKVGLTIGGLQRDLANPKKGLPFVLREMEEAFGGNIQAIRNAFPNIRGLSGLLELTGANGEATQEVFKKIRNSLGATGHAFKSVTKGEGFKFEVLMANLRVAGIRLGNVLLPIVADIAEHLTHLLKKFQDLSPRTQKFILIGIGIAAALGPVLVILGSLITVLGFLLSPIGLVVLAIVGLVAGFVYLYRESETVRRIVGQVWPFIQAQVDRFVKWFQGTALPAIRNVLNALRWVWRNYGAQITAVLRSVATTIISIWRRLFAIMKGILDFALAILRGDWSAAWHALVGIVKNIFGLMGDVLKGAARTMLTLAKLIGKAVWDGIKAGMGALASKVAQVVKAAATKLPGAVASFFVTAGRGLGQALIDAIVNFITANAGRIASAITGALPSAGSLLNKVLPGNPFKAFGGPVSSGTPYIVGERGPEMFIPRRGGTIIPNHLMGAMGGGGGPAKLTITNWEEGTGYIEYVADGSVAGNESFRTQRSRQNR